MPNDETRIVDEKGRITIPQSIRAKFNLNAGEPVEVTVEDGRIVVQPHVERSTFVETMRGCVNAATRRVPSGNLTPEELADDWTSDLPVDRR